MDLDRQAIQNLLTNIRELKAEIAGIQANVYRTEIHGQDDVSYIEAASLRDAVHIALHDYPPDAPHVSVFAELVAPKSTLAQYQAAHPGLFDVV